MFTRASIILAGKGVVQSCSSFFFLLLNFPHLTCVFLLQLREHTTSLTVSNKKNWIKFHSLFLHNVFSVHPSTSISLMFLQHTLVCFPSPISFLTTLFSYFVPVVTFPSFFLLHCRAPPAHHYLSQYHAHCPSLLHFSPGTRNETGASCPLFIISQSSSSLCPLCGDDTSYSSNSSSLPAPFRLLIRRGESNVVNLLILRHSTVFFLIWERDSGKERETDTVGCCLLGSLAVF